jgi:hypothetical protein
LIQLKVFVMVGEKAFIHSGQMVFEEIDNVQQPAKVHILLVFATKDWLPSRGVICLVLREVEMGDLVHAAEPRIQGYRGQAKLDSINESAFHACRDNLSHIPELV